MKVIASKQFRAERFDGSQEMANKYGMHRKGALNSPIKRWYASKLAINTNTLKGCKVGDWIISDLEDVRIVYDFIGNLDFMGKYQEVQE